MTATRSELKRPSGAMTAPAGESGAGEKFGKAGEPADASWLELPAEFLALRDLVRASIATETSCEARLAAAEQCERDALCIGGAEDEAVARIAARRALEDSRRAVEIRQILLKTRQAEIVPAVRAQLDARRGLRRKASRVKTAEFIFTTLAAIQEVADAIVKENQDNSADYVAAKNAVAISAADPANRMLEISRPYPEPLHGGVQEAWVCLRNAHRDHGGK